MAHALARTKARSASERSREQRGLKGAPTNSKTELERQQTDQACAEVLVPRARLELARQYDPSQDFKIDRWFLLNRRFR